MKCHKMWGGSQVRDFFPKSTRAEWCYPLSYILPYLGHTWGPCLFLFIKVKEVLSLQYADASKADTTLQWYVCCVITMESKGKRKKDPFHSDVCRAASLLLPPWSPLHHTWDKKNCFRWACLLLWNFFFYYLPLFLFTIIRMHEQGGDVINEGRNGWQKQ